MSEIVEVATGLGFPEGPIWMPDGSVLLVEIKRGTLSRVQPDGTVEVVAETGGGPNGAAIGPDGAVYICNNGGFEWIDANGLTLPGNQPADYETGSIQRVDLETGRVETLYTECDGHRLCGPNDLVFDSQGGFWFTDHGKLRDRDRDRGGIYYALPDGSSIVEAVHPLDSPNGIGLSPDGKRLFAVETHTGRLFAWDLAAPGQIAGSPRGQVVAGLPGHQLLDSLALDAQGNVCVATIVNGGVTIFAPDGSKTEHVPMPDPLTTNICFGGEGLRTAWITLSATGRLVKTEWAVPGLALAY
jgi:gluconolactonase